MQTWKSQNLRKTRAMLLLHPPEITCAQATTGDHGPLTMVVADHKPMVWVQGQASTDLSLRVISAMSRGAGMIIGRDVPRHQEDTAAAMNTEGGETEAQIVTMAADVAVQDRHLVEMLDIGVQVLEQGR